MNGKLRSIRKGKHSKLPPHSWEAHPKAREGEVNRSVLVVLIVLVVIVSISLLFFLGARTAGKATSPGGDQVNLARVDDHTLRLTIQLASWRRTSGFYMVASSTLVGYNLCTGGATVSDMSVSANNQPMWGEFWESSCNGDRLQFGDATLNDDNYRTQLTFDIHLTTLPSNTNTFTVSLQPDVYDAQTGADLFSRILSPFTISLPLCSQGATSQCRAPCAGTQTCRVDGTWAACSSSIMPSTETCNEKDDDCNGQTDENNVCNTAQNCGSFGYSCPQGQICESNTCMSRSETCVSSRPSAEVCDGRDNDCNGQTDENNVCNTVQNCGRVGQACTAGQTCVNSQCVSPIPQLRLTSNFDNGGILPSQYTCDDTVTGGVNPSLTISNLPAGTQKVVVVMEDIDYQPAGWPYVHWALFNIDAVGRSEINILEGNRYEQSWAQVNEAGKQVYTAPCPPQDTSHHYRFTAYALSNNQPAITAMSEPLNSTDSRRLLRSRFITSNILQQQSLVGVYHAPSSAPAVSSNGGGGYGCHSEWDCGQWGFCNSTLEQSKICNDLNFCDYRKPTKLETQNCAVCDESWVCTPWSSCLNGQQTRSCADEHLCGSETDLPLTAKSCQVITPPGPQPMQIVQQLPPKAPIVQQPLPPSASSIWQQYKTWIIAVPSSLIAVLVIVLLVIHIIHGKQVVYNVDELKQWIKDEKKMGTADKDIKIILAQHTTWNKEEIDQAFTEALPLAINPSNGKSF